MGVYSFRNAQAVYPAFFSLYVAKERRSSVQAMQFSNGLSNPAGLWLGHLMFDSIISLITATLLVIVFAGTSTLFTGLGYLVSDLFVLPDLALGSSLAVSGS